MSLFQKIVNSIKRNETDHDQTKIDWNVIKNGMTIKEYAKRYKTFHFRFKYKLFLPLIWFANFILRKIIIKPDEVDKEPHNELIIAFNEAFDLTTKEWCLAYRKWNIKDMDNRFKTDPSVDALNKIRDIMITGTISDTAYRNFFEMLSVNWAIKVGEVYPGKIGRFLFSQKRIDDVDFKIMTQKNDEHMIFKVDNKLIAVKKGDAIVIEDVKNLTKDLNS